MYAIIIHTKRLLCYRASSFSGLGRRTSYGSLRNGPLVCKLLAFVNFCGFCLHSPRCGTYGQATPGLLNACVTAEVRRYERRRCAWSRYLLDLRSVIVPTWLLMYDRFQVEKGHQSLSSVKEDFCDGKAFAEHPLFSVHTNALQLFFYFDEHELCNPLGSKTKIHKLGKCWEEIVKRWRAPIHDAFCMLIYMYNNFSIGIFTAVWETFPQSYDPSCHWYSSWPLLKRVSLLCMAWMKFLSHSLMMSRNW